MKAAEETSDLLFISCLPWVEIAGLTNPRDFDQDDSVPRVVWGESVEKGRAGYPAYRRGGQPPAGGRSAHRAVCPAVATALIEALSSAELKTGERIDDLQRGGLRIIQRENGFRFAHGRGAAGGFCGGETGRTCLRHGHGDGRSAAAAQRTGRGDDVRRVRVCSRMWRIWRGGALRLRRP